MFKRPSKIIIAVGLVHIAVSVHALANEDPLRPPGKGVTVTTKSGEKKTETWLVNEILHSEGRRLAIVNNTTVQKGDLVNGARVVDITAEQVTLNYKGRIINSRLNLVSVKRLKTKE